MAGGTPASSSTPNGSARAGDLAAVARGGAVNLVGMVVGLLCGLLFVVVVSRGLPARDVGLLFEAIALVTIAASIAQLGADTGMLRELPRLRVTGRAADLRSVLTVGLWPVVTAGAVIGVVLFVAAPALSDVFSRDPGSLTPLIRVLAPFLPLLAASAVLQAATRGFGTMLPAVAVDRIGRAAAQPLLALAAIGAGLSLWSVALAWGLPVGAACVALALWLLALLRQWEQGAGVATPRPGGQVFREFWRFTAPRGLAGVFAVMVLWLNTLLIGAMRSAEEAGVFAAGTRFIVFGSVANVAVMQVIAPRISQILAERDVGRAADVYRAGTWWLMALAWPAYLVIGIFAPLLLQILGGAYVPAQHVLVILAGAMLVATACGPVDMVLLMAGKSSWNLANTAFAVVLNVGLNLLLIPSMGIEGAAVAWAASIVANNLLPLLQIRGLLGIHPLGRGWPAAAGAAACFAVVGLASRALLGPTVAALAATLVLGGTAYVAVLWRFRVVLRLATFRSALTPRRKRPEPVTSTTA